MSRAACRSRARFRSLDREERGQSLVIVLSLITILFLLGSALAVHASVALRATNSNKSQGNDFYAADAATELGMWWHQNSLAGNPPAQTFNGVASSTTITGGCRPITPTWITGFEHGANTPTLLGAGGGLFTSVTNVSSPSANWIMAIAGAARSGSYGLRIQTQNASNYAYATRNNSGSVLVMRFSFQFSSLPNPSNTNADLAIFNASAGNALYFMYKGGSNKLAMRIGASGGAVTASNALTAGTWYQIDVRFNVGANPRRAEWRVNGVDQTDATSSEATAANVTSVQLGAVYPGTIYTTYFDDIITSSTSSNYPIGDSTVLATRADGQGPNSGQNNFADELGGSIGGSGGSTWQKLTDSPMTSTADYIKQVSNSGTSYIQLTFADTLESCIQGAQGVVGYHSAATGGNNGQTVYIAGSTTTTAQSGAMNVTSLNYASAIISNGATPWSSTLLNGIVARVGYSTDTTPNPYWDALLVEYGAQADAVVTVVGTAGASSVTTTYPDSGSAPPTLSTWTATQ